MMTPQLLEDYAQHVMRERLADARQQSLAGQLPHPPHVSLRARLAHSLRHLATRLEPNVAAPEPRWLIARSR